MVPDSIESIWTSFDHYLQSHENHANYQKYIKKVLCKNSPMIGFSRHLKHCDEKYHVQYKSLHPLQIPFLGIRAACEEGSSDHDKLRISVKASL